VHDVYSFVVGAFVCFTLAYTSERLYRAHKAGKFRQLGQFTRAERFALIRRTGSDAGHLAFFAVMLGGVVPTLSTLTLHVYLFVPFMDVGDQVPTVWLVQDWAYGVLWVSVALRLARVMPGSWLSDRLEEFDAARQQNLRQALRTANSTLVSVTIRLVAMLSLPALFSWALSLALSTVIVKRAVLSLMQRLPLPVSVAGELGIQPPPMVIAKMVYACCWGAVFNHWFGKKLGVWVQGWVGKVRDEEFLVERRLRNFEEVEVEVETTENERL
jgi:hypothetical protein